MEAELQAKELDRKERAGWHLYEYPNIRAIEMRGCFWNPIPIILALWCRQGIFAIGAPWAFSVVWVLRPCFDSSFPSPLGLFGFWFAWFLGWPPAPGPVDFKWQFGFPLCLFPERLGCILPCFCMWGHNFLSDHENFAEFGRLPLLCLDRKEGNM